jgi:hypothetical protein
MFGFTGRGDLGMKRRTDLWLADKICEVLSETPDADQGELLHGIAAKATALFARAYRGDRHAFVATGWARFGASPPASPASPDEFQPYFAGISNFHDSSGHELSETRNEFSIWLHVLPSDGSGFFWDAPHHLTDDDKAALKARLAAAHAQRSVEELAGALADQVLAVADRDDGVGCGLMITSCHELPSATRPASEHLRAGRWLRSRRSCISRRPEIRPFNSGRWRRAAR